MDAVDKTVTEWLHARGSRHLTVALAKELATESKSGWFVTTHGGTEFVVGKFALVKYSPNHIIKNADGSLLLFHSIEAARVFLAEELKVLTPAIFNFR